MIRRHIAEALRSLADRICKERPAGYFFDLAQARGIIHSLRVINQGLVNLVGRQANRVEELEARCNRLLGMLFAPQVGEK